MDPLGVAVTVPRLCHMDAAMYLLCPSCTSARPPAVRGTSSHLWGQHRLTAYGGLHFWGAGCLEPEKNNSSVATTEAQAVAAGLTGGKSRVEGGSTREARVAQAHCKETRECPLSWRHRPSLPKSPWSTAPTSPVAFSNVISPALSHRMLEFG